MADNKEMMNPEEENMREFYTLVDSDTNEEIEF